MRNRSGAMQRGLCLLLGSVGVLVSACADGPLLEPAAPSFDRAAVAHEGKSAVCHRTGAGNFTLIHVGDRSVQAHVGHGDALPGEEVPGALGYNFDAACQPVEAPNEPTTLTGTWEGTYAWDCQESGDGIFAGSTNIRFVLVQDEFGSLSGTAEYLGGTASLDQQSHRIAEPTFNDGGVVSGPWDADGMWVRIDVPPSEGHFVNNVFSGEVAEDLNSITGTTQNGDHLMPHGLGCSANFGPSGEFVVNRVG